MDNPETMIGLMSLVVVQLGGLGAIYLQNRGHNKNVGQIKDQVQNSHRTNLRDDLTDVKKMSTLQATFLREVGSQLGQVREEMSAVRTDIGNVKAEVGAARSDVGDVRADVSKAWAAISTERSDRMQLQRDVDALRRQLPPA